MGRSKHPRKGGNSLPETQWVRAGEWQPTTNHVPENSTMAWDTCGMTLLTNTSGINGVTVGKIKVPAMYSLLKFTHNSRELYVLVYMVKWGNLLNLGQHNSFLSGIHSYGAWHQLVGKPIPRSQRTQSLEVFRRRSFPPRFLRLRFTSPPFATTGPAMNSDPTASNVYRIDLHGFSMTSTLAMKVKKWPKFNLTGTGATALKRRITRLS